MEFANFTAIVRQEVEKRTGANYKVRISDVRKNNGVILSGLTVTQDDSNISPTIYLNDYYNEYENGRATLTNVVNDVLDTYNRNKVNRSIDMRCLLNYECVRKNVIYKLVNTEKNKELLEDVPHVEFLDLSIVFQYLIVNESFGTATILIHNAHMKLWDISLEELYRAARDNTQRIQKYEIKDMKEVICELMQSENPEGFDCEQYMTELSDSVPMYVLSNQNRVEGAACMIYPELIKDFATAVDSSFYIIPSSVHEVLLLPVDNVDESEEIKNMIREVNDSQVRLEEILSYSLYFYDKEEEKIRKL